MPDALDRAAAASSLIPALKAGLPCAKLTLMCQEKIAELFLSDPNVDEIFAFIQPSSWIHRMEDRNILNPIRHGKYDLGILTDRSFASAWWLWRGGVQERIGFAFPFSRFFLTKILERGEYNKLLAPLGIAPSPSGPKLWVSDHEREEGEKILHRCGAPRGANIIAIDVGSKFDYDVFSKLLENPGVFLVLLGEEAPLIPSPSVVSLAGKTTLRESMAIIQNADLFISNDQTSMSIASALGITFLPLTGSEKDIYPEIMRLLEKKAL